jgi:DNA-binding Lrp family transcriptional regulator
MESNRLSRFSRALSIAPMQLTERDREIIRLVQRHRFLRSSHIIAFIGGSPQNLLRRLQLLYHHGLLERPRAQLDYYREGGSRCMVYGLGDKGTSALNRERDRSVPPLRPSESNRAVGRIFLEHALLVSDVMVAIELVCRQDGRVRLLSDDELHVKNGPRRPFKWSVTPSSSRLKLGVIPDRVFGLEFPDQAGAPTRAFFFLEADRGTMPVSRRNLSQTSFFRKLLAYESTWSQSIHTRRFGFHRFRVLTITSSVERLRTLLTACSQLKRGQGLFLFAERTILDRPAQILSPIWQTVRPGERASLLD